MIFKGKAGIKYFRKCTLDMYVYRSVPNIWNIRSRCLKHSNVNMQTPFAYFRRTYENAANGDYLLVTLM